MNRTKRAVLSLGLLGCVSVANAGDWSYGFGAAAGFLDVSGDGGFNSKLGPIEFDASLEPDEVFDYLDSFLGLGGFASNGDITVTYSYGKLELEEDVSATRGVLPGVALSGVAELEFSTVGADILVNYAFAKSERAVWSVIGGVRYTDQEYDVKLTINNNQVFNGSVDDDWTDAVIGVSYTYGFSPTLSWSTQLDYGFGGSEGTTHFSTGLAKVLGKHWLAKFALAVKDIEYEEGDKGDADWYFYDATETTLGGTLLYLF